MTGRARPRSGPQRPAAAGPEVISITSAPQRHSDDLNARMSRYLISMLIRTVCVVLAVTMDGPLRWVFIAGAVFLPYIAVVLANASGTRRGAGPVTPTPYTGPVRPALIANDPPALDDRTDTTGEQCPPNG